MKCPRCQQENGAGAKFCEECATPLARTCGNCGRQLSATAKFCPECAHPASPAVPAPTAQRFISPESYTPKHLAEKILTSKSALEGEAAALTIAVHWPWPSPAACAPSSPTATSASASSPGARASESS